MIALLYAQGRALCLVLSSPVEISVWLWMMMSAWLRSDKKKYTILGKQTQSDQSSVRHTKNADFLFTHS